MDIQNSNEKTPIWKKQLRLPQQTFVDFAVANYRKKLLSDFIEESYFFYDKSNLIKESFIAETNKLISKYGSISYFGKKINNISEIISSNQPLEHNVKKDIIKKLQKLTVQIFVNGQKKSKIFL